ncbi:MAG: aminotransferase class I/II-fold pyridoxal phosphate-dependent enzyme [Candidatus Kapaibacterium sp.]|nr:MAG: aminotransferase class I/II-fold pyridoxal phosphate-dependent enzyme [Candidatus Kapabacteria bacterium]
MLPLHSKLPNAQTTIFTVMSELAAKHDAINLAQGFPNFLPSPKLIEFAHEAMQRGQNQYAPMAGLMLLRERIAVKIAADYGANVHAADEITITPGGTAALFAAMMAIVHKGDEVIVLEPCYDSYLPTLELCGAAVRRIPLKFPNYAVDWEAIRQAFTPRTRLLVLNTPHNPTGSVWSAQDMSELAVLTRDSNCIILSDEVYEHIIFDGKQHESVLRTPELAERSMVISSFGKTFHVTGWKTGYCVAPAALTKEFRKVYQFMNFAGFTPAQVAFAEMLQTPQNYKELPAFYEQKRNTFQRLMEGSRFQLLRSEGSYFQCATYDAISTMPDGEFAQWLTRERGVATIPVSAFYADATDHHVIRFCFAKTDETLERAAEILRAV